MTLLNHFNLQKKREEKEEKLILKLMALKRDIERRREGRHDTENRQPN